MKNNKGITLVALVITIIVLLILAGVSISMVVGENGVLNRATNAAEVTSEADVRSALENALSGAQGYFIDDWNKDQSLTFMNWIKTNSSKLSEDLDGYTITWTDTTNYKEGNIKKGTGKAYNFKIDAAGTYGAKLVEWNGTTLGS